MTRRNTDSASLRVMIVGCGNIAGGFDEGCPPERPPYTHAGAYAGDGRFELLACVEPDEKRRVEFMSAWNVSTGFCSIEDASASGIQVDVISICSPTLCHAHDLQMALLFKPRLIFCEKPLTSAVATTQKLIDACTQSNTKLAVNYTRRWDADVLTLQADMQAGRWGTLRSVVAYYNKGIANNGSHMIDLLHLLIGPMRIVNVGSPINDFFAEDVTLPVWLENEAGVPVMLACGHAQDYAVFELQLVFSRGVLLMEDGGMFWRERRVADSKLFKGYCTLEEGVRRAGEYPGAMRNAVDNLYRAIQQGDPLFCTGQDALAAQSVCEAIKQKAQPISEKANS